MTLTKSEVKAITSIFRGASTREKIAKDLKVSVNRLSPLLKCLKSKDFIAIEKRNRKLIIQPAKTQHAILFKKMLILEPGTSYDGFLYGLNFRLLSYCLHSWKPISDIAEQLGISKKTVLNRSKCLRNRLLLIKEKKMLMFNSKSWPLLFEFLTVYRNYTKDLNNVLWKFENEVVFEAAEENARGTITGFSAYSLFNIPVNVIKYAYYSPQRKLSKEEVFIHSLLQIRNETRLLELAVAFYYKNKLKKQKLIKFSYKYNCTEKLKDFFMVLQTKEGKIETASLPLTSAQGIKEMLARYKVK